MLLRSPFPRPRFAPYCAMPAPRNPTRAPQSKASRPEVHPLDEHLAALLNPALVEPKPQGFGEAPQPKFESPAPESHPRGLTGAAATAEFAEGAARTRRPQHPRRARRGRRIGRRGRTSPKAGGAFRVVSEFEPEGDQPQAIEELVKGVRAT